MLQFVLELAFVAFPCLKWCLNKALIGHLQFVLSVLAFHGLVSVSFLHCRYWVVFSSVDGVHVFGFSGS